MRIVLNGSPEEVEEGLTVEGLLARLSIAGDRVAVEVNLEVVRAPARARVLRDGDRVEVVSFVGGG